jgi:hypothetical protein
MDMTHARTKAGWPRLLAMVTLAYVLMLNGLLGAMASGTHVAEARIASQLGVICTIHGIGNSTADEAQDPTPGKLACIEHCALASASAMPALSLAGATIQPPVLTADAATLRLADEGCRIAPVCLSPLPRGPPAAT